MTRLVIISTLLLAFVREFGSSGAIMAYRSVDFEIFGRVQGVFFRKFTKEKADNLGLRGWCKNTSDGTVLGQMQGPPKDVEEMMNWLKTTGSPSSQIDKAEFRNQKDIQDYTFDSFNIKKDYSSMDERVYIRWPSG